MIRELGRMVVADNTGVKEVMVIRVLGSTGRRYARPGDVVVVSAKAVTPDSKIKKGEVLKAVMVRSKQPVRRADGSYISATENAAVLINNQGEPLGTRIFGVVFRELRSYAKILSRAPEVL